MTTISHQPTTFHYIELTASSTSSSSSSLLSTSSTYSDNENSLICKVTNAPCIESDLSSEKHRRKRKRNIRNTSAYLSLLKLPDFPVKTQCPNCSKYVVTQLKYKNGTCVYIFSMGLFALTGVLFWVPFFMDCCKDVTHFCPNCKCTLGTRRRI